MGTVNIQDVKKTKNKKKTLDHEEFYISSPLPQERNVISAQPALFINRFNPRQESF